MQACVREQRTLSVPKKQPGGDFHLIGPNATAAGRPRLGAWREPRDGALHDSTERTLCYDDYGVLSHMGPEHPSVLSQGRETYTQKDGEEIKKKGQNKRVRRKKIRREKQDEVRE